MNNIAKQNLCKCVRMRQIYLKLQKFLVSLFLEISNWGYNYLISAFQYLQLLFRQLLCATHHILTKSKLSKYGGVGPPWVGCQRIFPGGSWYLMKHYMNIHMLTELHPRISILIPLFHHFEFSARTDKTDGPTDGPTDGRTDGRTCIPSYRVAVTRLKNKEEIRDLMFENYGT